MNKLKSIGILSGAGAKAGYRMYESILFGFNKNLHSDSDYPNIVMSNYPFSCLSSTGVVDKALAKKELKTALLPLSQCDKIIVSCNSFHPYLNFLHASRLISLPGCALAAFNASRLPNKKALLLSSSSFKGDFAPYSNKNICLMDSKVEALCNKIISQFIKNKSKVSTSLLFKELSAQINANGYTHIIVACTELSLIDWSSFTKTNNVKIIDSAQESIKSLLNWYKS